MPIRAFRSFVTALIYTVCSAALSCYLYSQEENAAILTIPMVLIGIYALVVTGLRLATPIEIVRRVEEEQRAKEAEKLAQHKIRSTKWRAFDDHIVVRYVHAGGLVGMAVLLAADKEARWPNWFASAALVVWALVLAREIGKVLAWIVGIGVAIAGMVAMYYGIASLPTSVAIILGACIIGSAIAGSPGDR